jgi:hypothetical protein
LKRKNDEPFSVTFKVNPLSPVEPEIFSPLAQDFHRWLAGDGPYAIDTVAILVFDPKDAPKGPRIEGADLNNLERVDLSDLSLDALEEPEIIEEQPDSANPLEDNPVPDTSFVRLWDDSPPIPWREPLSEAVLYKHFPWCKLVSVPLQFIVLSIALRTNSKLVQRGFEQQ